MGDTATWDEVTGRIAAVRDHWRECRMAVERGDWSFDDIFKNADRDSVLAQMKLLPLIESIPDVGKVRSRRALEACGIDEAAIVSVIGGAERNELRDALEPGA